MSTVYEIPLSPMPQKFAISMAGVQYNLKVRWCDPADCWILDISDASGNPILTGTPLITGADLLAQYGYLGIGGQLIVQTDSDAGAVPTFANLGKQGHLYFVTTP